MKIYQALKIGEHHTNHCEDYSIVENIGHKKMLFAVMDGCTMGTDSHFAATLVGKLLRKIAIERSYYHFYTKSAVSAIADELKDILRKLMAELKELKNQLLLNEDELLTTLILMVIDTDKNEGKIIVIGDGVISINGQITEYDQDNRPDYLGYHLGESFEEWFNQQKQILIIDHISDVSICTDGILTFAAYDKKEYKDQKDPLSYLLVDRQDEEFDHMLPKKLLFLEQKCGLKPTDDVGIIRVIA